MPFFKVTVETTNERIFEVEAEDDVAAQKMVENALDMGEEGEAIVDENLADVVTSVEESWDAEDGDHQ